MPSPSQKHKQFEPVIGLEIHAQVSTKSKMFCSCSNDSFGVEPNTNVCPICMGFPGMLPVLNQEVLKKGTAAALALGCNIPAASKFDRKNYFYPDLPKGFQISQYDKPVSVNGEIEISLSGGKRKKIRIHRLHLEDDAGKLIHESEGTLCDYNRSGTPLMEIVSEPDMRSVEEASAYAQEIRRIIRYVGASGCDMERGMMRFDINISLRPTGQEKFGTRTEVKNVNSFKALERALEYEIARQTRVLEEGGEVAQETLGWDDKAGKTVSQRSKEEAHDYRYFPEPDLPPINMDPKDVEAMKKSIPELPLVRRTRFMEKFGISEEDAEILAEESAMADYFEEVVRVSGDAKKAVSFINTVLLKYLNADGVQIGDAKVSAVHLGALIKLIKDGVISNNMGKTEVFEEMYKTGMGPSEIVKKRGLKVETNTGAIEEFCRKVIKENPGPVEDFRGGKEKAFGFLVGKVMQISKGAAHPSAVNEVLRKLLS